MKQVKFRRAEKLLLLAVLLLCVSGFLAGLAGMAGCWDKTAQNDSTAAKPSTRADPKSLLEDSLAADSGEYSAALAGLCVWLSAKAEEGAEEAEEAFSALGAEQVREVWYDGSGTELCSPAAIFGKIETHTETRGTIIVCVIRGTSDVGDRVTNGIAFFDGFRISGARLYAQLLAYLAEIPDDLDECTFLLTGHSLGGAMADRLSLSLEKDRISPKRIYCCSFAPPGYGTTVEGRRTREYVHDVFLTGDLVRCLPPLGRHVGQAHYYVSEEPFEHAVERYAYAVGHCTPEKNKPCWLP